MNNPYQDILPPETVKIGRKTAWAITVVFLLTLVAPTLLSNIRASAAGENDWAPIAEFLRAARPAAESGSPGIAQRLREFETKLEEQSSYAESLRRGMQALLTERFREGNNRTVIGRDGWLYFRPALQALTGYGPITAEPQSVAKDPSRPTWRPALAAIEHFAGQLRERGIELVLVPTPVKPMLYPEHLIGSAPAAPTRHRDSDTFFDAVHAAEVAIIDVTETLWEMKRQDAAEGPVFLKQDTHWRPRGMTATVAAVASYLQSRPWFQELPPQAKSFRTETVTVSHIGDLVEKLDLPGGTALFEEETATLTRVLDAATGQPLASDRESPLVVLGDSFVNIFHDPGLGFMVDASAGEDADEVVGSAGFAQHLAMKLGRSLDVIAINGEASTGVRAQFARRYDDEVRSKKAVIWVIAARDLFLSETPAAGLVAWDDVVFNPAPRPEQPALADAEQAVSVNGTITMKSQIENPRDSIYKDALYTIELEITEVVDGALPADRDLNAPLCVVLWAFKDRKYSPESNLKVGQEVRVKLVPHQSKTALQTKKVFDESLMFDAQWFAEEVK